MPPLDGEPIQIRLQPRLTAAAGRLYSNQSRGHSVHGGTFLRQRTIVLDRDLTAHSPEFTRILAHELFHFVWVRLGNRKRRAWQALIESELACGAAGELGWSAQWRKDTGRRSGRPWREYLCESFCDTGAWFYALGAPAGNLHEEFTLAARFRGRRAQWLRSTLQAGPLSI